MRFLVVWAMSLGAAVCAQTVAPPDASGPAANPGRPTVTNPATLAPVGYLQFEQGYLGSLGSPETASQYGVNQVTRLAVHPRLGLVLSSQPFAASTTAGVSGTSRDAGGVQIGLQAVLFVPTVAPPPAKSPADAAPAGDGKSPVPTISLAYYHTVYGGTAPDVDLGSNTNSLVLLLSGDVGGFHYDSNYIVNEQDGDSDRGSYGVRRGQFAETLSVNHAAFNPNLQLSVEMYHFSQPLVENDRAGKGVTRANLVDLLVAPSYQVRPTLVLDCGFSHGLTSTSTDWQSFAGFTYLLPKRLWPERKK